MSDDKHEKELPHQNPANQGPTPQTQQDSSDAVGQTTEPPSNVEGGEREQQAPTRAGVSSSGGGSRKRTAAALPERGGGSSGSQGGQGYTALRIRASNHPDVLRVKRAKGEKKNDSAEDK